MDDETGEIQGYLMERLFEIGAIDVSFTPIYGKKNRPGIKLEIMCDENKKETIIEFLFRESSTIGVRIQAIERRKMIREIIVLETDYGPINCKKLVYKGIIKMTPEYEDCKKIAKKNNKSIKAVYQSIENQINIYLNK